MLTLFFNFQQVDQGGRTQFVKSIRELHDEFKNLREANEEDDQLDEDNDGIADVKQISQTELTIRKMGLFLRTVDPERVSSAFGQLYSILAMVIATLQVKFARAISLGVSIGNVVSTTFIKILGPAMKAVISEEYYPWVPVVIRYIARMIGISIGFAIQRVISTVTTALKGARDATDGFTNWTQKRNLHYLSDGYVDDGIALGLAVLGIYSQLFIFTRLPFIVRLVLFPFTFSEYTLQFLVSVAVTQGTTTAAQQANGFGAKAPPAAAPL